MQNTMKKFILIISILLLQLAPSKAQYVTIPDAGFVAWLTHKYPACMNGNQMDTTCTQIVFEDSVTLYPIPPQSIIIADISGIEYFVHLNYLDCQGEIISSLPTLPDSLKVLNCSMNHLSSLPSLPVGLKE